MTTLIVPQQDTEMGEHNAESTASSNAAVSHAPLLDALPYIDTEKDLDKNLAAQVEALIAQEAFGVSKKVPSGYRISHLPAAEEFCLFPDSEFLRNEYARVANGDTASRSIDMRPHVMGPPSRGSNASRDDWAAATAKAGGRLEEAEAALMNLELLAKFGAPAWKTANESVEALNKMYAVALDEIRDEITAVNVKRKESQEAAAPRLAQLNGQLNHVLHRTSEVAAALEEERAAKKQP